MKGQYLAIETMVTFGMGIAIAIGTITAFNSYKEDIMSSTDDKQAQIIRSQVSEALFQLRNANRGEKEVDLPERLAGEQYTLTVNSGIIIDAGTQDYSYSLNGYSNYDFEGAVEGGSVKIFKRENEFILRPS